MAIIWTAPRQWLIGEAVDDLKLQAVSDNFDWLRNRQFFKNQLLSVGSNFTQAVTGAGSGNWFAVNDGALQITVVTDVPNQRVKCGWRGWWSTSGALGSQMWWDVLIDTTWASTLTGTGSAGIGLGGVPSTAAAAVVQEFSFEGVFLIPTPGTHVLKPRIGGTNATTLTLYTSSIVNVVEFSALDI